MSDKELKPKPGGEPTVRRLTPDELAGLRREMAEASAWARTELKRRRAAVQSQANISENGISNGIGS